MASRGKLFRDDVLGDIRSHVSGTVLATVKLVFLGNVNEKGEKRWIDVSTGLARIPRVSLFVHMFLGICT